MQSERRVWWWRGALALGLIVFVVAGLSRISFNVDILKLLPTNLRQVQGLALFLREFAPANELIITVEAPSAEVADRTAGEIAARLAAAPKLVKRAYAKPPWESDPGQLTELLAYLAINQAPETVRALTARLTPANATRTLDETKDKLANSIAPQEVGLLSNDPYDLSTSLVGPLMTNGEHSDFASVDGTFHVVFVEAPGTFANYNDAIAWVNAVRHFTDPWQGKEGCHLGFTGEPAIVASISSSMQSDMQSSGLVTLLVIACLFYFCYRRIRPLLQLQGMLILVFLLTLATAGLFFDELTVIGVGSSAIMIGLSVDYGYFIYQRAQRFRGTVRELQRQCLRYIAWTAGTTGAAFFALNVSSLPGLSQLGNLVGVGVIFGAIVMLTVYAPLVLRRLQSEPEPAPSLIERAVLSPRFHRTGAVITTVVVLTLLAALVWKGPPSTDFSERPLRPRHSEAYESLDRMTAKLGDQADPLSLIVMGDSVDSVLGRLRSAESELDAAKKCGDVQSFRSALPLWPDAARQRDNLPILGQLEQQAERLRATAVAAGFNDDAFALTASLLQQWQKWSTQTTPIWPQNAASRWILQRVAKEDHGKWYALGLVQPTPGREEALRNSLQADGIYLTGWKLLSLEMRRAIPREFAHAIIGIIVVVLGLLIFAFRDLKAVAIFVATTLLVFAGLEGAMSLLGVTWNFFNLAAILLLLGTGTDYSILLLLALRRNGGDIPAARAELFVVICLCACSASAGFGTISWANHLGLASLGQTCALGLLLDAAISLFLIPPAWAWLTNRQLRGAFAPDRAAGEKL